jgi:preprotein translocase subunit SecF
VIETIRQIVRGESHLDIIERRRRWAVVSGIVLAISLVGIFVRHLNLGLEFKGGTSLTAPLRTDASVGDVEKSLEGFELGEVKVQLQGQRGGIAREVLVRAKHLDDRDKLGRVQSAIAEVTGNGTDVEAVSINDVGPTWGRQVSNKALRGLIVFLILVSFYIGIRFEPKMAVGALAALFHDVLATAGLYALIGFEVTPATVIALLTLLGFSLYDTVVVFDRIREHAGLVGGADRLTYSEMVNRSVNEVMMRSINTSLSTLLPIGALLFIGVFLLGAGTLKDLALAMFIGTLVSTYSSIFVAAPLLAALKEREPRHRAIRERAAAGTRRAPAPTPAPTPAAAPAGAGAAPELGSARPAGSPRVPRPPPRPRRRRRGKRR